jgi:N-acetyl-alpha-D-glucosaminyl L-malate synthase BshA
LKRDTFENFTIEKDIEVIYNFINLERFNKIEKPHFRKLVAEDNERVLIHVSNFRKVKRVQDVIKMHSILSKKLTSKLLLVGDGPERNSCEELCRSLGLCEQVKFLGKQEMIEELYAISDLFILPSESESFGLAALEAMACGVPVISTNAGGLPELIIEGKNGFMSDIGDVESMAENALKILLTDESLDQFKKNAFESSKQFNIDLILPKYEKYYLKVLNQFHNV